MAGLKDDLTPKNTQAPDFTALDSKKKTHPRGLFVSILKKKLTRQILKPSIPKKKLNREVYYSRCYKKD